MSLKEHYEQIEKHAEAFGGHGGYYVEIKPPGGRSYLAMLSSQGEVIVKNDEVIPILTEATRNDGES